MSELKCSTEGCSEVFSSRESLHPAATFTCRNHTRTADDSVRFQDHQFDKGLKRAHAPEGTNHLPVRGKRNS